MNTAKPIFWTDGRNITHRCDDAGVHPGVRLIWTECERDVPANQAFTCVGGTVTVDCADCIQRIAQELPR